VHCRLVKPSAGALAPALALNPNLSAPKKIAIKSRIKSKRAAPRLPSGLTEWQCPGGDPHGAHGYLTRCLAVGQGTKFHEKVTARQQAAHTAIGHDRELQEQLEELSSTDVRWLWREESLGDE